MRRKVQRARVFWSGRSQAVRLPKAFRFEGDAVSIRREGQTVILEPIAKRPWPPRYWESFGPVAKDFRVPKPLPPTPHRDAVFDEI